jgi:hypothetical protein
LLTKQDNSSDQYFLAEYDWYNEDEFFDTDGNKNKPGVTGKPR